MTTRFALRAVNEFAAAVTYYQSVRGNLAGDFIERFWQTIRDIEMYPMASRKATQ